MLIINDRDRLEWRQGMTVRDVLQEMGYNYVLITVTVNDELVPKDDYETHRIPEDARISIFHLHHGG